MVFISCIGEDSATPTFASFASQSFEFKDLAVTQTDCRGLLCVTGFVGTVTRAFNRARPLELDVDVTAHRIVSLWRGPLGVSSSNDSTSATAARVRMIHPP